MSVELSIQSQLLDFIKIFSWRLEYPPIDYPHALSRTPISVRHI